MKKDKTLDEKDEEILDTIGALIVGEGMKEDASTPEFMRENLGDMKPDWSHIKENTGLSEESLHRRLKNLREKGLIDKKPDPNDRRKNLYSTTEEGKLRLALEGLGITLNANSLKKLDPEFYEYSFHSETSKDFDEFLKYLGGSLVFTILKIKESDVETQYAWNQFLKEFTSLRETSLFQRLNSDVLSELRDFDFNKIWDEKMDFQEKQES